MRQIWTGTALAVALCSVGATAQDAVRLQFELRRGESVVARPILSLDPGTEGSMNIPGLATVKVTPTLLDAERVSLAFDISAGARQVKPRLVLVGAATGSITIDPESGGEESVGISVTRRR
jgi:hypothetical protein